MFRRVGVGAGVQGAPPRQVRLGGPDLVAVDPEHVAVALRAGAQAGEVRSGFRLGHAQRPPLVAAQQRDQQAVDLLGCAELADARARRRRDPAMLGSLGADRIAASSRISMASRKPSDRPPCSRGQVGCSQPASNAAR